MLYGKSARSIEERNDERQERNVSEETTERETHTHTHKRTQREPSATQKLKADNSLSINFQNNE